MNPDIIEHVARAICLSLSFAPDDRVEFEGDLPYFVFRWECYVPAAKAAIDICLEEHPKNA